MAVMDKTRNMLDGLVKEGSFKWLLGRKNSFEEEFEEMSRSPSGRRKCFAELSPLANVVAGRCSRILDVPMDELQLCFDHESTDAIRHPSCYARNFLEFCCFRALALSTQVLADKNFRRLTFDMMLAWEAPAASNQPLLKIDKESTIGIEAFSRIAPAVPIIADVITSTNLFDVLTASTDGRLSFPLYEKYLGALDRAIKNMKTQTESSHLSAIRSSRRERILDMDGTLTTKPVLEHVGMSIWPGRLTLTDHAVYFQTLHVLTYDKPKVYDLADDLKQVVRPELTGPLGSRLFDKGLMYKSISLLEPAVLEFPELTGHSRRDYWLAVIQEVIYAHDFIRKFKINGVEKEETLSKAVLGILRLQAIYDLPSADPVRPDSLLMFNVSDQLPGGDLILETLACLTAARGSERSNSSDIKGQMYSMSSLTILSNLGLVPGVAKEAKLLVGELVVGEVSSLEKAVKKSRTSFKKVELAQATVAGVKVEGVDRNLAVMKFSLPVMSYEKQRRPMRPTLLRNIKELLCPVTELGKHLSSAASWSDPMASLLFCLVSSYIILRGWVSNALALLLLLFAIFMLLTRICSQGRSVVEVKVKEPTPMNTMEQLLAVQNAISQVEEFMQDGNIFLLKLRALLFSVLPQATIKVALALVSVALIITVLPSKLLLLAVFLEVFTRYSPPRKASTERFKRRLREWWFSVPAAPVLFEKVKEDKKK